MLEIRIILQSPGYVLRFVLFIIIPLICLYSTKDLSYASSIFPVVACSTIICIGLKQALCISKEDTSVESINFSMLFMVLCALIIFCLLIDVIGFYVDIFFLSCCFYMHFERPLTKKKVFLAVIASLIIVTVLFMFLRYALQLVMPEGIFFDV